MNENCEIVVEYVGAECCHVSLVKEELTGTDTIVFVRAFNGSDKKDSHRQALMLADEIAVITGLPVNDGDA